MHWSLTKTMHAKGCLAEMPASLNSPRLPLSSPVQYQKIAQTRSHHMYNINFFRGCGWKCLILIPLIDQDVVSFVASTTTMARREFLIAKGLWGVRCVSLNAESTPLARLAKISYLHGLYNRTAVRLILLSCVKTWTFSGAELNTSVVSKGMFVAVCILQVGII